MQSLMHRDFCAALASNVALATDSRGIFVRIGLLDAMTVISEFLALFPDWALGSILLLGSGALAFGIYRLALKIVMRFMRNRGGFLPTLLSRVQRPMAAVVILVSSTICLQVPYFPQELRDTVQSTLGVGVILLLGWVAIVMLDVASTLYVSRFNVDEADNLEARTHLTQIRVLRRTADVLIILFTIAAALMSFDSVRQFGVSLFASAGAAGLVVGFAARPVLSNLIAGIQIAITQPIRIGDVVVVENEWGVIEEINGTYVAIKIWDWRRLVVPLSYFIEKPFQNWTRRTSDIIGSVFFRLDYTVPVAEVRAKLEEIVRSSDLWDKNIVNLQVTDCTDLAIELRALVSARTSPEAWDLRCEVREKMLVFLQTQYPECLPRHRIAMIPPDGDVKLHDTLKS